ncbi:TetR family transcriptional regulator [Herbiconiux solani]|uniref:TetR family transcriptional regulator n=1 Tax=Herbiconiux solani TaxID=661329 RepID=UPI000825E9C5|nr:TetR family transcriptional regulator [Herbiconiux solani]
MARWEPDARGRLAKAALELYLERGFEETTVLDIAERAGVTERTFFRHFTDKREVLFLNSGALQDAVVASITEAPPGGSPLEVLGAALIEGGRQLGVSREHARLRMSAITRHPSLLERELLKLSTLSGAASTALQERGVAAPTARLVADIAVGAFSVGFERWLDVEDDAEADLPDSIGATLAELRELAAPGA